MKRHYYLTALFVASTFVNGAYSEEFYLNGIWEKGKVQTFSAPNAWNTPKGKPNRTIAKDDILKIIDTTGYTNIDGNYTIKRLDLGRYLASKSSIGNIGFNMAKTANGKDGSLTIDTNEPKAKSSVAITSELATTTNDKFNSRPLKQQMLTIKGGRVDILNSANPNGVVELRMNTQQTPKTLNTFKGGIKFDSPLQIHNNLTITSNNIAFSEGIGYQVNEISFLDKTFVGKQIKKKYLYKRLKIAKLPTHYFEPLMIVNVGDAKHKNAQMVVGDVILDKGSQLNVYGTLDINGSLDMSWAAMFNIKKGGTVNITSKNIDKFAEVKTDKLARIEINGALNITNPKINKSNIDFKDVQMVVGEYGSIKVDGTGFQGMNGLYLERSLLSLKKGAKVYARNMVRLGEKSRLQLFGENQISAREPSNKRCRLVIQGRDTKVEVYANQYFDGFANANAPVLLRIFEGANEIRFVQISSSKWNKNFVLEIEGFKNGVIKIDNPQPMIATNVRAKGWKNFRVENGLLTADAE